MPFRFVRCQTLLLLLAQALSAQADQPMTLAAAQALALAQSPILIAAATDVKIRDAGVLQSGLLPNPEVDFAVENFGGDETAANFGPTPQYTLGFSQTVLRGGKRSLRRAVAKSERALSEADLAVVRLDLQATVAERFVQLLRTQAREDLAHRYRGLATEVRDAVQGRIDAGKASPVEALRAEVATSQSLTTLQRAERERDAAAQALAATWGGNPPTPARAEGDLAALHPPQPFETLAARTGGVPDLARFAQEEARRRGTLRLARAERITDLTASLGVRRLGGVDETTLVAGISIPLPVSDRNQGNIKAAEMSLSKLASEREATRVDLVRSLYSAHQEHQAAYLEATGLRDRIVPRAEQAFTATRDAYKLGKLSYLEVLDAQRTLLDSQSQYLDALAAYHKADITLHRFTGTSVEVLGAHGSQEIEGGRP